MLAKRHLPNCIPPLSYFKKLFKQESNHGKLLLNSENLSLCCSFDPSLSREERERAAGRAGFMQDLLLSMLFED